MRLILSESDRALERFCLEEIKRIKNENSEDEVILIVPDQYSYTAERLLTSVFGGTGLNGIEVMTFSRLANRYLQRVKSKSLSASGKTMIIQQAIKKTCDSEDNIYNGCISYPGFAKEIQNIISEFKRYMITPQDLKNAAQKAGEGMLGRKLDALSGIYEFYLEKTGRGYHDSDNDLVVLAKRIEDNGYFLNTHIIISEFDDFMPKHYKVIERLMKKSKTLSVLLNYDNNSERMQIPDDTKKRLYALSKRNNVEFECITLNDVQSDFNSKEIEFYHKNYLDFSKYNFTTYKEKTEDIEIFAAKDPYSEVERVARRIKTLIQKEGYRYSDISVGVGDAEAYNHIIQAVFSDYEIPYFSDSTVAVTEHSVIVAALGIFRIIENNWSYDSVFEYIKTGFIYENKEDEIKSFSRDDIDFLEAYILKRGIRGKKKWLDDEEWVYTKKSIADLDENQADKESKYSRKLNDVRRRVTAPIKGFVEKTASKRLTVREYTKIFYEFLEDIHLYEGLLYELARHDENGRRNEAEQLSLVWNILMEVLDQCVITLGEEKCTRKEFGEFLYAGLSECKITIIPSSIDSVTIGGADSLRQKRVKAMFILGAVRGAIPKEMSSEGILSDSDRAKLIPIFSEDGIEIGSDTSGLKHMSEFRFYRVLFTATDKIYLSYPVNNFEGDAFVPSKCIYDVNKIFDEITKADDLTGDNSDLVYSQKSAFNYLMENRNARNNRMKYLYEHFNENSEWKEKLAMLDMAERYKAESLKITRENAKSIYEDYNSYSVSRLNEFSACPFKHFLKYGLGVKPQEVWKIQKFDLGSLMHYVICKLCETVENGAKSFDELKNNWQALTKEKCDELVDIIIEDVLKRVLSHLDRDTDKLKYLMTRMSKTIKRSVETVRISLQNGEYIPCGHEKKFVVNLSSADDSVSIKGTIDRIDAAKSDDVAKLRIIDYKSGAKTFSVVSVSNMIDIQLIVYAACATEVYNKGNLKYLEGTSSAEVCGIMYNKIRDDLAEADICDISNIELPKPMKLNGLVILDKKEESDNELDLENALLMDYRLKNGEESEYLKIKFNKNGSVSASSELSSREDFNKMVEYVKKNIILIDNKIMEGDISVNPYSGNAQSACKYCDMADICMFDENKDTTRPLCKTAEEAWELINKMKI